MGGEEGLGGEHTFHRFRRSASTCQGEKSTFFSYAHEQATYIRKTIDLVTLAAYQIHLRSEDHQNSKTTRALIANVTVLKSAPK